MKISADGLLGSAQKINNKKKLEEGNLKQDKKEVKTDSLTISSKINTRIETIQKEIKDIQTSLTRNQIMRNGLEQIEKDGLYGEKAGDIISRTTFEGEKVLQEFIGRSVTPEAVKNGKDDISKMITSDINKLTRVQVEVDNIIASDLAGNKKIENLISDMNSIFSSNSANPETISNLNADKVMKLIR